jgi:hypothetical protein
MKRHSLNLSLFSCIQIVNKKGATDAAPPFEQFKTSTMNNRSKELAKGMLPYSYTEYFIGILFQLMKGDISELALLKGCIGQIVGK